MNYSTKGLYLVQIGRRICAQESIFFVKSLIKCKISEYFHYSKVRKYKMFEQTMCYIPAYDITNKETQVQVMHSLQRTGRSYGVFFKVQALLMDDDIINIILNNIREVFFPMCDFIVPKKLNLPTLSPLTKAL